MKRKSNRLLVLAVLAGVGVTGFLVVNLLAGEAPARRNRSGGAGLRTARGGSDARGAGTPAQVGARSRIRTGPSGGVQPGKRRAFDGPETSAQRRAWTTRVMAILDEIPTTADSSRRRALHMELQKLLRRLGRRVPRSVRQDLLAMLQKVDPQWRALVGDTLGSLEGDTETAQELIALFKQRPDNVRTRRAILRALGKMNVKEVVPDLLRMVRAGYEDEAAIIRALGDIGGREVSQGLLHHLDGALQSGTRAAIESALGSQGDPVVLETMQKGLREADPRTRNSYLNVLSKTRNPKYAPAVIGLLADERDLRNRKAAIRALGFFGDEGSGRQLLELVQSGSTQDRLDAARAVYSIRNRETVEQLASNWNRLNDDARLAVIGAGAQLSQPGKQLERIARDGLRDNNRRMRRFSAQLLGKAGNNRAVPDLVSYLRGAPTSGERNAALSALRKISTRDAAEGALAALNGVEMTERQREWHQQQFKKILARYR